MGVLGWVETVDGDYICVWTTIRSCDIRNIYSLLKYAVVGNV